MTSKWNQMKETDEEQVRKAVPMPVQKAKVIQVPDHSHEEGEARGYHQVYVKLYYDQSQERATVLTGKQGDVSLPEEGEDVYVLFGAADKPLVLGSFYPVDDEYGDPNLENVPEYSEGDRIIGNGSGSYFGIRDDGSIEILTEGTKPVNIHFQASVTYLGTDQTVAGDDTYYIVQYDTKESDPEDLFDTSTHEFTPRHDGWYEAEASCEIPAAGQNNRYTLAIFVNGTLEKRKSRQSAVNQELSLDVKLNKELEADDVVDARIKQDSGSSKTIAGLSETTEFTIERKGI